MMPEDVRNAEVRLKGDGGRGSREASEASVEADDGTVLPGAEAPSTHVPVTKDAFCSGAPAVALKKRSAGRAERKAATMEALVSPRRTLSSAGVTPTV
jgi:hypothetical protein